MRHHIMNTFRRYILVILFVLVWSSNLFADYLEIRRSSYLYSEPNKNSFRVNDLMPGDYLTLLDNGQKDNGYYHAKHNTSGNIGWVYKSLVRRYQGAIPELSNDSVSLTPYSISLSPHQLNYLKRHLKVGKPTPSHLLVREGYVVEYDSRLKLPIWIQYELNPIEVTGHAERSDDFRADTEVPYGYRSELSDYSGSDFDRGHMAPAADMKRSINVMSESFLLSNMAPQVGVGFNRHIWKNLEDAIRGWVQQRGGLTIITGPVFYPADNKITYQLIGDNRVAVPTHFFKIVLDNNDQNKPDVLAFLLPNQSLSGQHYKNFLVSIDNIEKLTGMDFLSDLPKSIQSSIESQTPSEVW